MIAAAVARRKSLTVNTCDFVRLSVQMVVNYSVNSRLWDDIAGLEFVAYIYFGHVSFSDYAQAGMAESI
jgi:hypothetical protein